MKTLYLMLLAIFCLNISNISAENCPQKIYVESKNIQIHDNKIMLKTRHGLFPLKSIHSDKNGLYVVKAAKNGKVAKHPVRCPGCDKWFDSENIEWHFIMGCPGKKGKK